MIEQKELDAMLEAEKPFSHDELSLMKRLITDRVEAIKKAITLMDDDTILFLPGKGRETREKRGIEYIDTPSDADVVIEYMK